MISQVTFEVSSLLIQEIFGNAGVGPHALQVTRQLKHHNAVVPGLNIHGFLAINIPYMGDIYIYGLYIYIYVLIYNYIYMGYIRFIIYIYMYKYGLVWMDKSFPLGLDNGQLCTFCNDWDRWFSRTLLGTLCPSPKITNRQDKSFPTPFAHRLLPKKFPLKSFPT